MIGWEIGIAGGSLAALVYCFGEASKPGASPLFLWGGVLLTIVFFLSAGDSLYRVLSKAKFKERINDYIAEGYTIIANVAVSTYDTPTYLALGNDWSTKIAKSLHHKKGQSEKTLFLDEGETRLSISQLTDASNDCEKRSYTAQIIGFRLNRLEDLRKRL